MQHYSYRPFKVNHDQTVMYKVLKSSNPYYVGKRFRLIQNHTQKDDRVFLCFFRPDKDLAYYQLILEPSNVATFFKENDISYEIDQDYGKEQIEYLKHKIEMLKINYELPDHVLIEASSLSLHSVKFKDTYEFQLECD